MSKFSNILKMLIVLKSRGKIKIKDLADILEVNERMIRKYKNDIEMAGIYVKSIPGKYGGYQLESPLHFLEVNFDTDELTALTLAYQQLKDQGFIFQKHLAILIDKLKLTSQKSYVVPQVEYMNKQAISKDLKNEEKICLDINSAAISQNKIRIKYFSLESGEKLRVVHPYAIITYKGSLYFVAYCELREEIREFKISRIREYKILDEKFEKDPKFSLTEYMRDNIGLYRDDKLKIKLKIYKPMSYIVSEKIWVEKQKIVWNDDESIIFEAELIGKTEIKSWILSMGRYVRVLEPETLKEDMKEEINIMKNIYL